MDAEYHAVEEHQMAATRVQVVSAQHVHVLDA